MSIKVGIIASSRVTAAPPPSGLLLDAYPGAAAAYSLRKLRTAYTGPCIRCQRSLDNIQFDVGFDANGVIDVPLLVAACAGLNGFVAKWYDQSGNGIDAFTSSQPQIVVNGVVQTQNGKPAIIQTVTYAQYLETTYSFNLSTNKLASIFSVTKSTSDLSGNYYAMRRSGLADYTSGLLLIATDGGNLNRIILGRGAGGGSLGDSNLKDFTFNPTIQQLSSSHISTSSISIYKNANLQTLSTSIGTMPLSDWLSSGSGNHNIILGGRNYNNTNIPPVTDPTMRGNYQEFVFYLSNQLGNNTAIQNNINSYYSIY
jgi:hypothetical protein